MRIRRVRVFFYSVRDVLRDTRQTVRLRVVVLRPMLGTGGHVRAAHHRVVHRYDPVAGRQQPTGCAGDRVPTTVATVAAVVAAAATFTTQRCASHATAAAAAARVRVRHPAATGRGRHCGQHDGQVGVPDGRLRRHADDQHQEQKGPYRDR